MKPAADSQEPAPRRGKSAGSVRKSAARGGAAKLLGTVLGTVKGPGGHYQVRAPAAPTRHVSGETLDQAVRQVIAAR
jgi:hypothetical protein